MTQKKKFTVHTLQRDAYKYYLEICNYLNEVPRLDIVTLISGCNEESRLKETIEIFKKQTGKPKTEKSRHE